ncbi:hypothetical protein HAX54_019196 [Datura stramonium]|uniref:Uncharacterized protein n=1 Tax=Datura stramonium TaxID=4076 RepID=A0ABS8URH5_DATST|nr:hypothetical protein [Datura stramonium]
MAASVPLLPFPTHSRALNFSKSRPTSSLKFNGNYGSFCTIRCSSNGREPESLDEGVKRVEKTHRSKTAK